MLPEQQQRIMGYFIEEAKDHLNTIEQGLLSLQTTIEDSEKANELFRAAHSVKGGAAMLGLESIQRTAHRMEDYFKILKESPVQVDRTLETMFLRISDGLKDLLEQLEGPFGLTLDKAQEIMTGIDPVFGQLETHLESLVGEPGSLTSTQFSSANASATSEALQTAFKRDVALLLRQLLTAFKRDDNLESRKALQETCAELVAVGKQFELNEWCDLAETARIAVGELGNDYRKLAPILIKEIKKAQDMVLTGRASEVAVSDAMQALLPEDLLSESTLPAAESKVTDTEVNLAGIAGTASDRDDDALPTAEAEQDELADLFGESDDTEGLFESSIETEGVDEFEGLFDSHLADGAVHSQADVGSSDEKLEPVNRLSVELEFDEIPSELSALNRHAESEEKADESLDALLATVNVTGPDVGSEELNSLADLFDGDLDELDNTLGNHTFISEEMRLNPEGIDPAAEDDLTDLFTEEVEAIGVAEAADDDGDLEDDDLFGGTLTDGAFVTLDDSFIDAADLEPLNLSSAAEQVDSKKADDLEKSESSEVSDIWTDENLFGEATSNIDSAEEASLIDESDTSSESSNGGLSNEELSLEMAALTEDVWTDDIWADEEALTKEETIDEAAFSQQDSKASKTELPGELESAELDLPLDDLDLSLIDIEEGAVQKSDQPSLTETLIAAQSATPREVDIEFPTLTGAKLQEAEEDIDSFFVGEADDNISDSLISDDAWEEIATDSEETAEESSLESSLELAFATEDVELQPELEDLVETIVQPNDADAFAASSDESSSDEIDLDEVFGDSEDNSLESVSEIDEAGSELDALLEVSSEPVSVGDSMTSEAGAVSEDLWSDLEAASDLLEAQTAEENIDFLLDSPVEKNNNDSLTDSFDSVDSEPDEVSLFDESSLDVLPARTENDSEALDLEISSVREAESVEEELFEDKSVADANSALTDELLQDDFLNLEASTDSAADLDLASDDNASTLSESDLLDFDTAFGLEIAETNELSVEEDIANERNVSSVDEQDLPTFSGDLDAFADAADGETTISDISDLRLEDAELDSLLGLDFAIDESERSRKDLLERGTQTDEPIDSSVIEAFSDVDDLFSEDAMSVESDSEIATPPDADENDDFFGLINDVPDSAADSTDFDELDSLLSEDILSEDVGSPTESADLPTLIGTDEIATSSRLDDDDEDFDDLERLLGDGDSEGGETPTRRIATRPPRRSVSMRDQNMRVSVKHLDNLSNLVGELVVSRNTLERDQERLRQFLDNLLFQVQQLNDVGQRLRDLYERSLLESSLMSNKRTAPAGGNSSEVAENDHATGATFDALEMDRFTGFHSLSQEMIELIVRVRESSSDIGYTVESSDQVTRQFRQITTQLQEGLNTARMVAFSQAADRLPRAVRDISLKCGKEARLVVEGQDTLIDKMIVEHLYDPLTHLVNNAITHGIEMPETRTSSGKSSEGSITVRAFYQGNQTVIYVADDGGGIDTKFVQRKAIEKGLISQSEAEGLSDIETYDLLFHPGFSTRDQADDFAGRGVGMDVVRTSLAEIRGSITIDSELGRGTSFTIRLPLTLSISKALSCVSNQARIAFPMDGVEDMLDVPRDRVVQNDQDQNCVRWRETLLPFQPVTDLLKFNRTLGRGRVYGGSQEDDVLSVIVLRSANTYVAVQVDQVIGEEEIVIKQLEGPVPKPLGIAGATVLGDGRVMPIADVLELIDIAMGRVRRESSSMMWAQEGMAAVEETPAKSEPTVLIVDDSITVRELLSMSFNKVGYRVEQARDGQEAWDKLRSGLPCDLVFCDIEMPRMDGLELLSRMQKDSQLKRVPIAMLTSRGADRHRQMAVDLGASGYFTKPYLEEALLDAAQRMLNGESLEKGRGG